MSKINSAESIRGLACIAVVFSHLSLTFVPHLHNFESSKTSGNLILDTIHNSPFGFAYSGTAAVYTFFVLSGYILSYAILSKKHIDLKIKAMSLKRYPRLAIPAAISCLFAYLCYLPFVDLSKKHGGFLNGYNNADFKIPEVLYEGLIGSFLFGTAKLNVVLWTMQIELLASFLLFFLLFVYLKFRRFFLISSLIAPIPFILIAPGVMLGTYAFVFGSFLYLYAKKIPYIIALPMLLLGLYFAGVHTTSASYSVFTYFLKAQAYPALNFLAGILIVTSVLMNEKLSQYLNHSLLVKLGALSFSIYLLHFPLIYLIAIPVFNLLLDASNNYALSVAVGSLVHILLTIFLSIFYSKYIDQLAIAAANKIENIVIKKP